MALRSMYRGSAPPPAVKLPEPLPPRSQKFASTLLRSVAGAQRMSRNKRDRTPPGTVSQVSCLRSQVRPFFAAFGATCSLWRFPFTACPMLQAIHDFRFCPMLFTIHGSYALWNLFDKTGPMLLSISAFKARKYIIDYANSWFIKYSQGGLF
jgi:hypothetical protein